MYSLGNPWRFFKDRITSTPVTVTVNVRIPKNMPWSRLRMLLPEQALLEVLSVLEESTFEDGDFLPKL